MGDNADENLTRKKVIEYKPSKAYELMNKKMYMLPSDMKHLNELYKHSKRAH